MTTTATTGGDGDRMYPVARAAKYLSISPRTLHSLRQHGKIKAVPVSRWRIAFDKADLDAFIEQQKQAGPRRRFGRRS